MEFTIEVGGHVKILRPGDTETVIGEVVATPGYEFPNGRVAEQFEILVNDGRGVHYRHADEIEPATEDEIKEADPAQIKCIDCEGWIDTDVDGYTLTRMGEDLCYDCERQDMEYATTVLIRDPDDGIVKVLAGDHLIREAMYFDEYTDIEITRTFHRGAGYRGHYETTLGGFTEMLTGWTTGMPDDTVTRKFDFNEWVENFLDEENLEAVLPFKVAVVLDPTTNVFATAVGVWVEDGHDEEFLEILGAEADDLRNALT